ncbi:MAG TPA: VanZ family protein [Rhizobacter sp.]|nr:VanZ family protein [Rhizobacter sp.]
MSSSLSFNPLPRWVTAAVQARRPWQWLLFLLVVVVCYLALVPQPPKTVDLGWDKLNHASAFAALAVSGCFGFPGSRRAVLGVLLGLLARGGLIESVQYFGPGRSCDWHDLVADAVGIACGLALAMSVLKLARQARAAPA